MSITLVFGDGVSQATQNAANSLVAAINNSGIFQGNKNITISNFSQEQLSSPRMSAQTGNTNGSSNSQIQINQDFDYQGFNESAGGQAVSLSGSILHELTHALYPGAAGSDNNVHNATFYIDELNLADAIGIKLDYSDVYKAGLALQRDQGLSANDAQNAIAKFPSSGIQPTGQVTGSHIDYNYKNDGFDPSYVQSISTYGQNGVLSGTATMQSDGSWDQVGYTNGVVTSELSTDSTGNKFNGVYYNNSGQIAYNVSTEVDGTSGSVTATVQSYSSAGTVVAQANVTPDTNGDGGSLIRFATADEMASLNGSSIDPVQVTPNADGSFTFGSPQADREGLVNQLTVDGSLGLAGLTVTDPTTGAIANIAFDNGSSTSLQEGRSVATDAPNEQAITTESDGQIDDAVFGQGADIAGSGLTNVTLVGDGTTATLTGSNIALTFAGTNDTLTIDQTQLASGVSQETDTYVGGNGTDQETSSLFNFTDGSSQSDVYNSSAAVSVSFTNYSGVNESGSITQQGQYNTDGSSQFTYFDPSSGISSEVNDYDANENETFAEFNFSNGTSETDTYDPQAGVSVEYADYSGVNETGLITQQGQYNTDGSSGVQYYDANGNETFKDFNYANGTSREDAYDPVSGISDQYTDYSGVNESGSITQQGQYDTDGSSQFTFFDPSADINSEINDYNANGTETLAAVDYTNGTSREDLYNPTSGVYDQYAEYSGADETGSITQQGQFNTDGSSQFTYFNPSTGIDSIISDYDTSGNEISAEFEYSDGTSQSDAYNPQAGVSVQYTDYSGANQTGYISLQGQENTDGSSDVEYYDASGSETSADFNYSNGTSREDTYNSQSGVSDQYTDYSSSDEGGSITQTGVSYTTGNYEITYYNPSHRIVTDAADYNASGDETYSDETFIRGRQEDTTYDYNRNGVYTGDQVDYYSPRDVYEGYEDYNRNGVAVAGDYDGGYDGGGGGGGYDGGGYDGGGYDGGGYDFARGASSLAGKGTNIGYIASFDLASGQAAAAGVAENALAQAQTSAQDTQTPGFEGAKWVSEVPGTPPTITWSFATNPGSAADPFSGYLDAQYQAVVEKAVQTWAKASGLNFVEIPDSATSDLRIGWGAFDTQSSGVLGYTSYQQNDGAMKSGTIIRLEDPSQDALSAGNGRQFKYDGTGASLYQVVLHEIGHALGLADNGDPRSVMYASSSSSNGSLDKTALAGIRQLYGSFSTDTAEGGVNAITKGGLRSDGHRSALDDIAGTNQLIQAMASFDPERSVSSLTGIAKHLATPAQTLAASLHH